MRDIIVKFNKESRAFMLSFCFFFAYYTPLALQEIIYFRYIFWCVKISVIWWMGIQILRKKIKWKKFDLLVLSMCGFALLSGVLNIAALMDTLKFFARISSVYLFFRILIDSPGQIRQKGLEAVSWYFCLVCLVNTLQIIAVGGQEHGYIFFLSSDNGCAKIYIASIFFACVRMLILGRKYTWQCIIVFISAVVYAFVLQVGAAVLSVAAGVIFFVIYLWGGDKLIRAFSPDRLYALSLGIWLSIFMTKLSFCKGLINRLFFQKYNSISSRVDLWRYFVGSSLAMPLGHGAGQSQYDDLVEGIEKWTLIGNCHNIFVDAVYHYGFITLILFITVCFIAGWQTKTYRKEKAFLGMIFFMYMIHGLVEGSFAYAILYVPILYYLPEILTGSLFDKRQMIGRGEYHKRGREKGYYLELYRDNI